MTCVAYRDGILASDSLCSTGGIKAGSLRKVVKTKDGFLVGGSGRASSVTVILDWWMDEEDKPPLVALESPECMFIVITPDGTVLHYEGDHKHPMQIKSPFHTIGSGSEVALGAMEMGASATSLPEPIV